MKQRITREQLLELIPEQQKKLQSLWKPTVGDVITGTTVYGTLKIFDIVGDIDDCELPSYNDSSWTYRPGDCLPLLSIGQMIELLGQEETRRTIIRRWHGNELCDALWEATKNLLARM